MAVVGDFRYDVARILYIAMAKVLISIAIAWLVAFFVDLGTIDVPGFPDIKIDTVIPLLSILIGFNAVHAFGVARDKIYNILEEQDTMVANEVFKVFVELGIINMTEDWHPVKAHAHKILARVYVKRGADNFSKSNIYSFSSLNSSKDDMIGCWLLQDLELNHYVIVPDDQLSLVLAKYTDKLDFKKIQVNGFVVFSETLCYPENIAKAVIKIDDEYYWKVYHDCKSFRAKVGLGSLELAEHNNVQYYKELRLGQEMIYVPKSNGNLLSGFNNPQIFIKHNYILTRTEYSKA